MWDTVQDLDRPRHQHLGHDLPCLFCGHAAHHYLPCDAACGCAPVALGSLSVT